MEEIKVGEYIRILHGTIEKVEKIDPDINNLYRKVITENNGYTLEWLEFLKPKHSPNIIDLIEEGDYVNGKLVSNVDKVERKNFIEWEDGDMYSTEIPNDKFIKDIVTKEQFNQMKYIVGDDSNA